MNDDKPKIAVIGSGGDVKTAVANAVATGIHVLVVADDVEPAALNRLK